MKLTMRLDGSQAATSMVLPHHSRAWQKGKRRLVHGLTDWLPRPSLLAEQRRRVGAQGRTGARLVLWCYDRTHDACFGLHLQHSMAGSTALTQGSSAGHTVRVSLFLASRSTSRSLLSFDSRFICCSGPHLHLELGIFAFTTASCHIVHGQGCMVRFFLLWPSVRPGASAPYSRGPLPPMYSAPYSSVETKPS